MNLLEAFLNYHLDRGHSGRTVEAYNRVLSDFLGQVNPNICTIHDLYNYVSGKRDLAANSRNLIIACIKSFFKWMVRFEYRKENPAGNLERVKLQKSFPRYVTEEDFAKMYQKAKTKLRLMITLGFRAGLRLSEILNLKIGDFIPDQRVLVVRKGKGAKERWIPLCSELSSMLSIYLKTERTFAGDDDYIFLTGRGNPFTRDCFYTVWNTLMKKCGLKYNPHALRHGFGTEGLKRTGDIKSVSLVMGHSSVGPTQIYTHLAVEDLRKVVGE
jgi:site-specific recombinase XerD